MIAFLRFFRLFAAALCLLTVAFAQKPDAPKPPKLRFLFIDETAGIYSIKFGSDYKPVSATPYEVSAPFTPGDFAPLVVYKALPDPVTGKARPVKIATVTPPANTTSALVIITPRPAESADVAPVYKVEILDGDPSAFPAGSIRIINRSPVPMAAQFSDNRVITAPGEANLVQPVADSRNRVLFKIAIQIQQASGGWKLIQDSITVIRPKERMVGLLVYSPSGMRHMLTADEILEMGPPKPGCFWLTYSEAP